MGLKIAESIVYSQATASDALPYELPTTPPINNFPKFSSSECLQYFGLTLSLSKLKPDSENQVKCPFHEHGKGHGDKHPSLSINTAKGVWHCHAGCGGGNIIDFEMK